MESLPFAGFLVLFYGVMFLAMAVIYGGAIWAIVDIARRPDWAFRMAGLDKTLWLVLIAVLLAVCWVANAALVAIYFLSLRPRVQEAEAAWYAHQPPWAPYPGQPSYPGQRPHPYGQPPTGQ